MMWSDQNWIVTMARTWLDAVHADGRTDERTDTQPERKVVGMCLFLHKGYAVYRKARNIASYTGGVREGGT